jgi:hypothetical protein
MDENKNNDDKWMTVQLIVICITTVAVIWMVTH